MSRRCRIIFLVFGLLVNTMDLISDWLFYVSADKVEKGLVYGPINDSQVTALLVFSIIGSVAFVVEVAVFIFQLRKDDDHHGDVFLDLVSAFIIWVEDIPQVIISFSIALCREEAISVFQLTKAGLVLAGIVINVTATLARFCKKRDSTAKHCAVRACLMLGIIIEGGFAIAIFYLTQTELDTRGEVAFRVPTTIIDEHLSDQQYLSNVYAFINHADIFDAWNLDTHKQDSIVNWLRLFSLNDLKDKIQLSFKFSYYHVGIQVVNMAIWFVAGIQTQSTKPAWVLSQCYSIHQDTAKVSVLSNRTCIQDMSRDNGTENLLLNFHFDSPGHGIFYQKRLFGEIFYNLRVVKNHVCYDGNTSDSLPTQLHYFRVSDHQNSTSDAHLYADAAAGEVRFYRNQSPDMTDVADFWRTGWKKCKSTGSMAPVLDRSIKVKCDDGT